MADKDMKTLRELMNMEGKVALITGGAGHIGRAMGEALLELGAAVVLNDVNEELCAEKSAELGNRFPGKIACLCFDVGEEASIQEIRQHLQKEREGLDVLIHSAAFVGTTRFPGWAEPLERQSLEAWEAAFRVNLGAAFSLTRELAPLLREKGRGSVIYVSSIYGLVGPDISLYEGTSMQNPAAYGASKAGLLQLTRYFATTLAPEIRVNAITPGGIARNQPDSFVKKYEQKTPLGRMGVEEDLKGAAAYLASDLSRYVTGHNLVVDGGWTAW